MVEWSFNWLIEQLTEIDQFIYWHFSITVAYVAANIMMISEWWFQNDVELSCRSLFEMLSWYLKGSLRETTNFGQDIRCWSGDWIGEMSNTINECHPLDSNVRQLPEIIWVNISLMIMPLIGCHDIRVTS